MRRLNRSSSSLAFTTLKFSVLEGSDCHFSRALEKLDAKVSSFWALGVSAGCWLLGEVVLCAAEDRAFASFALGSVNTGILCGFMRITSSLVEVSFLIGSEARMESRETM